MKKFISILLCAAMLAAVLCGCGKDKPSDPGDSSLTTRPQITSPTRPQKTEPENTTPKPTTTAKDQPADAPTKRFTYEELSLYIPEKFEDMSQQAGLDIYDFVVGDNDAAICATRNDSAGYEYMAYAKLIAENAETSGPVTDRGGYATFEYQASGFGMDFEYIVGIFPSGDQMWIVQAYCQTKDAQRWKSTLEAILESVEIDEEEKGSQPEEQIVSYTYEEVTIQVPSSLKEDKATIEGTGFSFCLSRLDVVVVGLQEDVSSLGDISEEEYLDLMIQANQLDATLEKHNGHTVFVYNGNGIYKDYTYIGCSYKLGNKFWTIQAFTHSSDYPANQDMLIQIVTSAEFD